MANQPSIYKTKVSLQLDNEVVVALDIKAEQDNTSRNAVANYYLAYELQKIIDNFSAEDKAKVEAMEIKNKESRNGNK